MSAGQIVYHRMGESRQRYRPEIHETEGSTTGRIAVTIHGPNHGTYFAGDFTPEEAEAYGVALIAAATKARLGIKLDK